MLNIDKALGIYSDKLIDGEKIDIVKMSLEVMPEEREEFIELAKFIEMTSSIKVTQEFKKFFEKLNDFKEDHYSCADVANFRSEKGNEGNSDIVNQLFNEEFDDEE